MSNTAPSITVPRITVPRITVPSITVPSTLAPGTLAPGTGVIVGVDTHKLTHAAVAISALGARLGAITIPVNAKGYRALKTWAQSMGQVTAFGIEGTGSYGAGLSRFLCEHGHTVLEVNRPNRQLRRQKGKDDPLDAESAARAVLAGQAAALPKSAPARWR